MGGVPREQPRLVLQAQYSVLPVFALQYRPVALQAPRTVDRYVNRLLIV